LLGLLKYPDIDACVHDNIAIMKRKYKYAPAFIEFDLKGGEIVELSLCFFFLVISPIIFSLCCSSKFLKRVSGEKYNSAFAGSLYLGWYWLIVSAFLCTVYVIQGRFKIEIIWCYNSPYTFRDFPTSMQTEIDIPIIVNILCFIFRILINQLIIQWLSLGDSSTQLNLLKK